MCGIAGIVNLKNQPAALLPNLVKMSNAMRLRGPDDEGFLAVNSNYKPAFYYGNETNQDSRAFHNQKFSGNINDHFDTQGILFFAHRRLKIIDLSPRAFQPMTEDSNRFILIFNGEIYNYKELRQELISYGYIFQSASDSEVLLKSYMHWQESCLHKFNGDFALVIYDSLDRKLFLARDRVGVKPLFYTVSNDNFIFASDIKTILASELVSAQVNMQGLWNNLTMTLSPGRVTSFKDIFSLEPGCSLTIDLTNGEIVEKQYWDVPHGQNQIILPEDQLLEMLEEKIIKAVKYRLTADVEVGSFMSGGIDSTTVTAMAAKINPGMKALTLGFYSGLEDETREASINALKFGVQHIISRPNPRDYLAAAKTILECYEEPYNSLTPSYFMSESAHKENLKVVLTGVGGDELFAGYPYYPRWQQLAKYRPWQKIIAKLPEWHSKVKNLKRLVKQDMHAYYAGMHALFTDCEAGRIFKNIQYSGYRFLVDLYPLDQDFNDYGEMISYLDLKWYVGRHQLYRLDQFSMHFSVEGRFPLLDHELLETAMKIPIQVRNKNNQSKYLLRKIAEKYIAPESLTMKKFGFSSPDQNLINGILKPLITDQLHALKKRDFINPSGIDQLLSDYSHNATKLLQLCQVEQWLTIFIDQQSL